MNKKYILFIELLTLILFSKCANEDESLDISEENFYDNYDENGYFKSSLKEYLVKNKLFDSEKVIEPEEMKRIFLEVITEGDPETSTDHLSKIFNQLAEHFVERYYDEKKQIRGKDIYNLLDINEISIKFGEIVGENPLYDKYNEEEDDLDAIEPKTEL